MADTIEISNNTLIKLKVRSGTDQDRRRIILDVGELGYTTDTRRLYVGDATAPGGLLAGNLYNGARSGVTNPGIRVPERGDYAYDTTKKAIYIFQGGDTSSTASWLKVSHPLFASDDTINISGDQIRVNKIFAANLDNDVVGDSINLDPSNRITLQPTISVNKIDTAGATALTIPVDLQIGDVQYTFPARLSADNFLQTDVDGNLTWSSINNILCSASAAELTVGEGLTLAVNGEIVTSTQLLTSSEVNISGIHLPVASCTFKQDSTLIRSKQVTAVDVSTGKTITDSYSITHNGVALQRSNSIYDNAAGNGTYLITLDKTYLINDSEVEIFSNNASYFKETTAIDKIEHISSHLEAGYRIIPVDVAPTTFNQILVYFYATTSSSTRTSNTWNTKPGAAILTPGYNNAATRFQVNVYGDSAP